MFMYEYTHGGNIYDETGCANENIIDFSANINPLGIPEEAVTAAENSVSQSNKYPDSNCLLLSSKLAEFENADKSNIFCGNGASDILFRLAFAVKPKKILVTAPSFADYERAGRAAGAETIYYMLKEENNFIIEKDIINTIFKYIPDIVFICTPNNPTGNLTDIGLIKEIAAACTAINSILLIDECFLDFVPDPDKYSSKLLSNKNAVILKAFTKMFAMPGLRLGYAVCGDTELIGRLRSYGPDWAVSNVAQEAGIAALKNGGKYMEDTREYVKKAREYITEGLNNTGMTVYPSYANFVFFNCPYDIDLYSELRKKMIVIRDCANFKGLDRGYYRAAVLTNEKNKMLLEAVKGVIELWRNQL